MAGYPVADTKTIDPTAPDQHTLTPAEQETCDQLYAEMKPTAIASAREYIMARTPVYLQEAMTAKIDTDFPPPPEA